MILLEKVNEEIENLIKLKEILERTEVNSTVDINIKFEDDELDRIFVESLENIIVITKLKGINIDENYPLKRYISIYESEGKENTLIVNGGNSKVSIKIKTGGYNG